MIFRSRFALVLAATVVIAGVATIAIVRGRRPRGVTAPAIVQAIKGAPGKFYKIDGRPLTKWGDYGDILQNGMTAHLARDGERLSLERTGPYMPPITFPGVGDVVLNAEGRTILEGSGLTGFTFRPVSKTRIVNLAWEKWDLSALEPPQYPESGEPEDFILERPHDAQLAERMGDIWELVVPVSGRIGRPSRVVKSFHELWLEQDSWNGADIFRGDGYGGLLVTERAKAFLQDHFGLYMRFEEFGAK